MKAEEPETSAEKAGLILSDREEEGITREKVEVPSEEEGGSPTISWDYRHPNGKKLTDKDRIEFLNSLAVPPAWTEEWFCPNENGHIQATMCAKFCAWHAQPCRSVWTPLTQAF